MHPLDDGRFYAELRACTAELAEIIGGDLERPVPTCPEWTLRQLATHVGRGHRWAAEIVATRATSVIPVHEVPDGKLPEDPARHAQWLNAGAARVIEAVTAAGSELVWTFIGMRPAPFWGRRRAPEAAVHLAGAQLAAGRDAGLAPGFAGARVGEMPTRTAAGPGGPTDLGPARAQGLRGQGQTLHFHATDPGLAGTGEWLVARTPSGITVQPGHGKADVAVRGPAVSLLLVLTRRLTPSDPTIEVHGDHALFTHWLQNTPF